MPLGTSELLRLAQAGDRGALEQLARVLWPRVRRWALLETGDAAAADDACQEALVKLVRSVKVLRADQPVEGWMRTVVRNCCRDARRKAQRAPRPPAVRIATDDLERAIDLVRGARSAVDAFRHLSVRQREALDLVDRLGLTPKEAAQELGVAPGTVRALLHQGRRALRESLLDDPEIASLVRDR